MSVPRLKTATSLLLLCAVVSGCNGNRAEDLPVITAFHPDGTGGGIDHPEPAGESNGYVLSYAAHALGEPGRPRYPPPRPGASTCGARAMDDRQHARHVDLVLHVLYCRVAL